MSDEIRVRRARAADIAAVVDLERASFGKDAYDRNLFADYLHKCGDLFLVAALGGSTCGYLIACERGDRVAELISVAVNPPARRRGVGSILMDSVLRRLRRRGIRRLTLMVKVTNDPALTFYRKYGFRRVRTVRGYYEDAVDGLLMVKEIG